MMERKSQLKSINGRKCLTKCYPPGETYFHPVILRDAKNNFVNTCAVYPTYQSDLPEEGGHERESKVIYIDQCRLADNDFHKPPHELETLLLGFHFDPTDFLVNIYKLPSFNDVIYWTKDNYYMPVDTIKRIHNCAWKAFGNKLPELTTLVIDYYYRLAKDNWLKDYIEPIRNKFSFKVTSDKREDASREIYNIISDKFFDYDFFVEAIRKYVEINRDDWDNIDSHYLNIKKFIYDQLVERMNQK